MKLIATLTTLPSRIAFIEPVLESMLSQSRPPDEIHLQIPNHCLKEDRGYQLPAFLKNYPQVKVMKCDKDFGPATKWLPALNYLAGEKALLLVMDDDCYYPPSMVEKLLRHYEHDVNRVYCSTGGVLKGTDIQEFQVDRFKHHGALTIITDNKKSLSVDTVQGFSLILFDVNLVAEKASMLSTYDISGLADDILLSGLFEQSKISRIQIAPYQVPVPLEQAEINPIHGEGKLTKMTLETFIWVQQHLKVWTDYTFVVAAGKIRKSLLLRVLHRVRHLVGI